MSFPGGETKKQRLSYRHEKSQRRGVNNICIEKVGLERLKEALEANEWASGGPEIDSASELEFDDEAKAGFGLEAAEVESEIRDLKAAIYGSHDSQPSEVPPERRPAQDDNRGEVENEDGDGNNSQIEELESMMLKMQAIKGNSFQAPFCLLFQV